MGVPYAQSSEICAHNAGTGDTAEHGRRSFFGFYMCRDADIRIERIGFHLSAAGASSP